MLRHVVKRRNGEIARELAVCGSCQGALGNGRTPSDLRRAIEARRTGETVVATRQQQAAPIIGEAV